MKIEQPSKYEIEKRRRNFKNYKEYYMSLNDSEDKDIIDVYNSYYRIEREDFN